MKIYDFRFIDLFAGIGGFHQAMRSLGGECVMASEINQACIDTYKINFKTTDIRGDIRGIDADSIPPFDVLCAGFPCQSFSKAGLQKGFEDEDKGDLFHHIIRILKYHTETKVIFLENVRNLADKKENWDVIKQELLKCGFFITEEPVILSPSDFGIPQIRERVYILGIRKDLKNEELLINGFIHFDDLSVYKKKKKCNLGLAWEVLEENVSDEYCVNSEEELMIQAWDEFRINTKIKTIGFPIWISSFGFDIQDDEEFRNALYYYEMKKWKQNFVDRNRALYKSNKEFIDTWIIKYDMKNRIKLFQKFEWNCGEDCSSIKEGIVQIRQSGIRVKRPNYYPSLVVMDNTPIIWDKNKNKFRRITPREAANLQNFDMRYKFIGTDRQAYQQLGNSVNVKVLKMLGKSLFKLVKQGWDDDNDEE